MQWQSFASSPRISWGAGKFHLTPRISNALVGIPGFNIFRKDGGDTVNHGVCAFLRDRFPVDEEDAIHPNVLSFYLSLFNVYIFVVYRPPFNSSEQNDAHVDYLGHSCADKEALLIGDFNLPSLDWSRNQTQMCFNY